MRRLTVVALLACLSACTATDDEALQIVFALSSSDELQAPAPGTPCTYSPVTSAGGFYWPSGMLDVDPAVNPGAEYFRAFQVENFLSNQTLTDSNGNTIVGPNENNFEITDALVSYTAEQSFLNPDGCTAGPASATGCSPCCLPGTSKFLTSGLTQVGGVESALAVEFNTVGTDLVSDIQANLQAEAANNGTPVTGLGGDIVLNITVEGTLASGEHATSGVLQFPLHVCFDCFGVSPTGCPTGETPSPAGHGPCCESEDFSSTCISCGGVGQACCAMAEGVQFTCSQDTDCTAYGFGGEAGDCVFSVGGPPGICACQSNGDCLNFGASSVCLSSGLCSPGCNSGGTCSALTSLPTGFEECGYPNQQSFLAVCASSSS